ncbi:molybdopterin-dependent oxidoreductase [Granulicella mallensis]|uniref:NADH dehydrogenase (Quinone) n=1 Tax=Granulicella mallensis (strain ATCC BAA-1857 / DSM 23137 / MP5ACTX8) TaxID=682795 RepID=G8P014_GRAMM|nr:molybdopterin-dependent oxidoreductase [Granulicella mallensis]AEU35730.1 NADH dehydrogenase (quinone) [Granulicella mallensis MP5ACTX8]
MPDVTFTVDGQKLTAPAGTLLIDACKSAGIEIPAFCYYPNLSLQAACRMCVVRIEKMPKLQTACTTPVAEGMNVTTETPEIAQARKATLQLLLGNHPLDCPVCDAGGECELQDMTFKYGAADSFYTEPKNHREEQKWSPVVYFDRPRCILCYRCVRMCGEGMDVFALGIQNRGSSSVIAPNVPAQLSPEDLPNLDCEQCGMCIDACPVGALTSGTYRYKTRPWEMNHVATVCTHCGDGCKTTLGVRSVSDGSEIVRGDNRDKSGMNGDFLCNKGRYAFDFTNNIERLTSPLVRQADGKLKPVSWDEALRFAGKKLRELRDQHGAQSIGVIGSNRTTNEENYLLQKFARTVIGTNNIDHHRTADYVTLANALQGTTGRFASQRSVEKAQALLVIGGDPTNQAPLTAWNLRTNVRLNKARVYIANHEEIKLRRQAKSFIQVQQFGYGALASYLAGNDSSAEASSIVAQADELSNFRSAIKGEEKLVVLIGNEVRGGELANLIKALPNAEFGLMADYVNSRGASDMGLLPDALPGYQPISGSALATEYSAPAQAGLDLLAMFDAATAGKLSALYVVGSNPIKRFGIDPSALKETFVIVQDLFLTETAQLADVVFPAANLYEKAGSVTNSYGDLQLVSKAADKGGARSDFELIVRLADNMGHDIKTLVPFGKGLRADMGQSRGAQSGEADRHAVWLMANNMEPKLSPFDPFAILDEIQRVVPGYDKLLRLQLLSGNDQHIAPASTGLVQIENRKDLVLPSSDTLFTSGSLTRYSPMLQDVQRHQETEVADHLAAD